VIGKGRELLKVVWRRHVARTSNVRPLSYLARYVCFFCISFTCVTRSYSPHLPCISSSPGQTNCERLCNTVNTGGQKFTSWSSVALTLLTNWLTNKVQHRQYQSPTMYNIPSQFHLTSKFTTYLPRIHLHIILPPSRSPNWKFSTKCSPPKFCTHLLSPRSAPISEPLLEDLCKPQSSSLCDVLNCLLIHSFRHI
jgi:hypothetical protein